jgi:hypothetical protein
MKTRNQLSIVTLVGFVVTGLAILGVILTLLPAEQHSLYFWQRIGWLEFLNLLVWAAWSGFLVPALDRVTGRQGISGITPAIGIVVTLYAVFSAAIMVLHALLTNEDLYYFIEPIRLDYPIATWILEQYSLPLQIIIAAIALVILIFFYISLIGVRVGTERLPAEISTPYQLGALLRSYEDTLPKEAGSNELKDSIKALREKLTYSLPPVGSIASSQGYAELSGEIKGFCSQLQTISAPGEHLPEIYKTTSEQARRLQSKVALIVEGLKRG